MVIILPASLAATSLCPSVSGFPFPPQDPTNIDHASETTASLPHQVSSVYTGPSLHTVSPEHRQNDSSRASTLDEQTSCPSAPEALTIDLEAEPIPAPSSLSETQDGHEDSLYSSYQEKQARATELRRRSEISASQELESDSKGGGGEDERPFKEFLTLWTGGSAVLSVGYVFWKRQKRLAARRRIEEFYEARRAEQASAA